MPRALVLSVRLHDDRYHGAGEWPPSPARLFQALVAGAGLSGQIGHEDRNALEWFEECGPPIIGAPRTWDGQSVTLYVPNNDLDKVGGDPRRIAEIRGATKTVKPRLVDATIPFLYAWTFEENGQNTRQADTICALAERLYQFGRGVDFAWAWGEVLDNAELEERLLAYPGTIHRASPGGSGPALACPKKKSLSSLFDRYSASAQRFKVEDQGKKKTTVFAQSPRPRFAAVAYDSPASRYVYELRERSSDAAFAVWPLEQACKLVIWLRDGVVERLRAALPSRSAEIDRVLIGRRPDGSNDGPISERVRIVPLPSIGHPHADRGIRRVLVEVPASCPLRANDVHWAFSGLELIDPDTGEVLDAILIPVPDETSASMLAHCGVGGEERYRRWRTVTAAALPEGRRRIEPTRRLAEAKSGRERGDEVRRAATAVLQALRHAAIRTKVEMILVQREPFEAHGERVEAFSPRTRFAKERLWHVEITFAEPVAGPLVIGDGRFLGLGLMAPVRCA